jgi:serine/threonine protein kinase
VAFCAVAGFTRGLRDVHDQVIKTGATVFPTSLNHSKLWSPQHPIRHDTGTRIDDKYTYLRHLGSGQEGFVDLYIDESSGEAVVVKQMVTMARNPIPAKLLGDFIETTTTWPTEIEAGLLLADNEGEQPYVRILDYFILRSAGGWSWAMVAPLMTEGTLVSLAEKERSQSGKTIHEIDSTYRSVFEDLLKGLQPLHTTGLCHNDIKPNNVFLQNSTSWLLGDLGNVRHPEHPWHFTASWTRQNQWADCRANDVRRVLKTYLSLLRAASPDRDVFDDEFWHRHTSWSMMFWDFQHHPVGAEHLAKLSRTLYKPRELDSSSYRDDKGMRGKGNFSVLGYPIAYGWYRGQFERNIDSKPRPQQKGDHDGNHDSRR